MKFTISISGGPSGFNFAPELIQSNEWSKNNIEAGDYRICFTTSSIPNFEQCFNVVITEEDAEAEIDTQLEAAVEFLLK